MDTKQEAEAGRRYSRTISDADRLGGAERDCLDPGIKSSSQNQSSAGTSVLAVWLTVNFKSVPSFHTFVGKFEIGFSSKHSMILFLIPILCGTNSLWLA